MKKYIPFIILSFYLFSPISAYAAEKYTVYLKINNGEFIPPVLNVPTNKIIRIKISNIGNQPAEFESTQLRKEKVLAPGASSVVIIAPLRQGTYTFFDDFHLEHLHGKIIAQEPSQ
ncbi:MULTISPECIES: cupredoxin domain-containing protein [Photobacterium]|uniref:Cupredoxin domain-containing protein n=2 Tax=Photobacterium TaxID=657 RepID=A0A2T3JTJ7_PHOPO|nr:MULTISPECIES: cupredoxin domain-containing protein [Photobacterium]PLC56479.1 hypothetical protein CIK00_18115 [Photobacterium carnosum]PSU25873.1 cupredoxin domain-containing protein [Photobacterium phosphoreum]PSU43219.1 cupredoxin domain-containing protein [Photobacterium phosphoreum]PSU52516.1 cupredoxin domain-containing protein [Photobacterium phosphoreum]